MNLALDISYPPVPYLAGISPHGILTALGILAGFLLVGREVRRRDLAADTVESVLTWAVLAGIVGARVLYVIGNPGDFGSIGEVLAVWNGGLALFGGLIAGIATGLVLLRRRGAHLPRMLDVVAPALAFAVGIGRIGDLLLTDHLGKPTDSPWALAYEVRTGYDLAPGFGPSPAVPPPPGASCADVGSFYAGCSYHLTPAYDMLGAFALFALLMLLRRRSDYRAGTAISVWAAWYGTQRFVLDFTRAIDEQPLLGLTTTQLLAAALAAAGLVSLVAIRARGRGWAESPADPPSRHASLRRTPIPDGVDV